MAGLVPALHVFLCGEAAKDVDARDKRGHDALGALIHFVRRESSLAAERAPGAILSSIFLH
jgi:hypothetical protein